MRARILWTMGFHPHPRIKSGAGSSLPPSMGKELGALLTFAALIALLGAGCADGGIRGPLSDNDGPEAMDVGNRAFDANLYEAALNAYAIAGESCPNARSRSTTPPTRCTGKNASAKLSICTTNC